MEQAGCVLRVDSPETLAVQVSKLFNDNTERSRMQSTVKKCMEGKGGAAYRLMEALAPVFDPGAKQK